MWMRWVVVVFVVLLVACSSDPVPTCEQAFGSFYKAGCVWDDPSDARGPAAQPLAVAVCEYVVGAEPAACRDDIDAWLRCFDDAPTECDCTAEQNALIRCSNAE
jgi:hypothetical protein